MDKISQQKSLVKGKINALSAKPPSEPLTSKFCQLLGAQDFIQPDDLSTLNSRFRGPKNGVHRTYQEKQTQVFDLKPTFAHWLIARATQDQKADLHSFPDTGTLDLEGITHLGEYFCSPFLNYYKKLIPLEPLPDFGFDWRMVTNPFNP